MMPPATDETELDTLGLLRDMADDKLLAWVESQRSSPAQFVSLIERAKTLVLTDLAGAERTCDRLVRAAEFIGIGSLLARALTAHAHALAALSRFDLSLDALARAVNVCERTHAPAELAGALLVSVQPHSRRGELPQALAAATRAEELFTSVGDAHGAAKASVNAGVVLRQLDDPEGAIARFSAARDAFSSNPGVIAQIDSNTAEALLELNRFADAESAFASSLAHFERAGNSQAAAIVEGNLADLLNRQGRFDESLRCFERSIRAFERSGSPGDLSRLLTERAEVYATLALWDQAAADLDVAIPDLDARGMSLELCRALMVRALVHTEKQEAESATDCLDRAIAGLAAAGHETGLARATGMKARLLAERGDSIQAVQLLQDTLRAVADRPAERARLLLDLGACHARERRLADAVGVLTEAVTLAQELEMSLLLAQALHARGAALLEQGARRPALADLDGAMDALDHVRARLPGEHSRVAFAGRWSGVYEDAASAMLKGASLRDQCNAFDVVERGRCRALLDKVRGDLDTDTVGDPTAQPLVIRHRSLVGELNALYSMGTGFQLKIEKTGSRHAWRARAEVCEQRLAALEVRMAAAHQFRGIFGRPATTAETGASLPRGTVLVQYAVVHADVVAFVLGPDGLRTVTPVGSVTAIESRVRRLEFQVARWLTRSGGDDPRGSPTLSTSINHELSALHNLLIAPVAVSLRDAERLIFSPAGPIHAVPFESLLGADGRLIERAAISYAPSASVLIDLARSAGDAEAPRTGEGRAVIIAVPDEQAPRMAVEAEAVAAVTPDPLLLIGDAATSTRFFEEAPGATLLHVACHALAPDSSPFSARLRFSDRWVTAREISGARLRGCGVVLSGCETGRGAAAGCEELFGLVRAFLAAGASSVIATRWPVHDLHTTRLMVDAYVRFRSRANNCASMADGLRAAQIHAANQGWHPAIWSSFLAMGAHP